ncbi:MAG: T9SS type A sorting domain-containing protein [Candidatus Kapaibacterium sp.]
MKKTFITALLLVSFYLSTANSTTHRIIVGFGSDMVFSPQNISSAIVGDTIKWVWESGFHNTVSNTIPGGAASWNSLITSSDTVYSYVITVPGIYNYECTFHSGMTGSFTAAVTGLQQIGEIPISYSLSQNYPNPFNPVTKINFSLPLNNLVQIKVYDVTGKEVAELLNNNLNAGEYSVSFDASKLTSGVYFYKLSSGSFTDVKKMLLIK